MPPLAVAACGANAAINTRRAALCMVCLQIRPLLHQGSCCRLGQRTLISRPTDGRFRGPGLVSSVCPARLEPHPLASACVNTGGSTEIVSLLSLPVNINGT